MINRFDGKVAIVTGGSSGIGAAIIARLISEGAQVLNADINAPATVADAVIFHLTDVRDAAQVQAMVAAAVARFGRLDVLINNAGIGLLAETPDMAEKDWDRLFAVNVTSVFHACKAAIPQMRGSGGAIVNVASISGLLGDYGMGAYNASKAAVIHLTKRMAARLIKDQIVASCICPGAFPSEMNKAAKNAPEKSAAGIPSRRVGTIEDMAGGAIYLASRAGDYIVGTPLPIDGGIVNGWIPNEFVDPAGH